MKTVRVVDFWLENTASDGDIIRPVFRSFCDVNSCPQAKCPGEEIAESRSERSSRCTVSKAVCCLGYDT